MNDLHSKTVKAAMDQLWSVEYPPYKISEDEIYRNIERTNLYVLDEVGMRMNVTDAHYSALKKVMDIRYGKPMVMISNLSLDEIAEVYDQRISSRLMDGTVVELTTDRRGQPNLRIASGA